MEFWKRFWVLVTRLLHITTLTGLDETSPSQHPLGLEEPPAPLEPEFLPHGGVPFPDEPLRWRPPGHRNDGGPGQDFICDYTKMGAPWEKCSTAEDRSCWLRNPETKERYDINTDYEHKAPNGTTREYWLTVTNTTITADGYPFYGATVFNGTYPGPWIQACWGDTVVIHVTNNITARGVSIHWHGIRQYFTMQHDGVNGITQCPIAPGVTSTYSWKAVQYGSAWYHSHYSDQYADGLLGPLTLHGPSSGNFDEAADIPTLITDWRHASVWNHTDAGEKDLQVQSFLLNGVGDVTQFGTNKTSEVPTPYTLVFDKKETGKRAKRYLLRLINTSIQTTFVFSIDNHLLTIVSADFVPIYPYSNTSLLIGIGQRYNVIVEADPRALKDPSQPMPAKDKLDEFWIRTWSATNCGGTDTSLFSKTYEQTGILRYKGSSGKPPRSKKWDGIALRCSDETYTSLRPVVPWTVGTPINQMPNRRTKLQHLSIVTGNGDDLKDFPKASFAFRNVSSDNAKFGFTPLQVDFADPIMLHLDDTESNWPPHPFWEIYPEAPNGKNDEADWVWLAISSERDSAAGDTEAHPIHLHGHDFAILQQAEDQPLDYTRLQLNRYNPPRRDVVLMPTKGFIVIAFKADNPGSWLLHCHIARHASAGLGLQILERQKEALRLWGPGTPVFKDTTELCDKWKAWVKANDPPTPFPDDSGV
ncbi:multicopper oxidase-domain-containing protein [Echria macrotheca]|uniref:Multicopper oxidase-domain-containing protein n=1 Tax=Echria macrotheca TaxID=438768 RepID=A0AAJ0F597_9PEZI|nr:multicopper oxidase-domain-containing protein [Echria macrotheca]